MGGRDGQEEGQGGRAQWMSLGRAARELGEVDEAEEKPTEWVREETGDSPKEERVGLHTLGRVRRRERGHTDEWPQVR